MSTGGEPRGASADEALQRALSLHRAARLDDAAAAYEEVLRRDPRHPAGLTFLSALALERQQAERALALSSRALDIDPANVAARLVQGHSQTRLGQHSAAIASYEHVIALRPDIADAHWHRGVALTELGRHAAAIDSFNAAILLQPNRGCFHASRGLALYEMRRLSDALASLDRALALEPAAAEVHLIRALVLKDLRQLDRALASLDQALELKPDLVRAHANRGNVLGELERFEEALESYDQALRHDPGHLDTLCNRGNLLAGRHRFAEALACFDRALELDSDHAQAHYSRAFVHLVLGDWERGWREFEWRFRNEHSTTSREARAFRQPQWRGEPVEGRTVLLHCEQGLGDTLQFCRFATSVAERGGRVVLEAPAALASLLKSLRGVDQLVSRGEALPDFDLHCPLLSLPLALGLSVDRVPADVPYLSPGPEHLETWRKRLGRADRLRVGLAWAGGFRPEQPELWGVNQRRNIPLAMLAPLAHPGIAFYSLQKGEPAESELAAAIAEGWNGPPMADFGAALHDFEDTAALIEQLDLVICVDTSIAHLAGALGKPVWILNRFDTCWRWLLDRSDTPWYPSARLYRQAQRGDWLGVIGRVREDLFALASER